MKTVVTVTQSAADTATEATIPTYINGDNLTGWSIVGVRAYWKNAYLAGAADGFLKATVQTVTGALEFGAADLLATCERQHILGAAGDVVIDPIMEASPIDNHVTVQPTLYCRVASLGTGIANVVVFEVYYEPTKLKQVEFLQLQVGGS